MSFQDQPRSDDSHFFISSPDHFSKLQTHYPPAPTMCLTPQKHSLDCPSPAPLCQSPRKWLSWLLSGKTWLLSWSLPSAQTSVGIATRIHMSPPLGTRWGSYTTSASRGLQGSSLGPPNNSPKTSFSKLIDSSPWLTYLPYPGDTPDLQNCPLTLCLPTSRLWLSCYSFLKTKTLRLRETRHAFLQPPC